MRGGYVPPLNERACGPVEQGRTADYYTVSLSPAGTYMFVSLGNILTRNPEDTTGKVLLERKSKIS